MVGIINFFPELGPLFKETNHREEIVEALVKASTKALVVKVS